MSEQDLPAFPGQPKDGSGNPAAAYECGMTLRDYFAGQALAGALADPVVDGPGVAEYAYGIADEMLKARAAT